MIKLAPIGHSHWPGEVIRTGWPMAIAVDTEDGLRDRVVDITRTSVSESKANEMSGAPWGANPDDLASYGADWGVHPRGLSGPADGPPAELLRMQDPRNLVP